MSEPQAFSDTQSSPGAMLRAEREHQRLPLEDAAEQLNLRPSLVGDLEKDVYTQMPVPTYRRGYLRAYARLLGMDDRAVVAAYDNIHGRSDMDERRVEPIGTIKPPTRWGAIAFRVVTIAIVVALIVLTLVWWEGRESAPGYGTAEVGEMQESGDTQAALTESDLPPLPESSGADTSPDEPSAAPASTAVDAFDVDVASAERTARALEDAPARAGQLQLDTPRGRNGATGGLVDGTAGAANDAAGADSTSDSGDDDTQGESQAIDEGELQFSFNGQSWVDVRDDSGATILRGLQQSGTSAMIEGAPPFTLTVGNASQVELEYRGESVDVSQHTGGNNVARFTLGE